MSLQSLCDMLDLAFIDTKQRDAVYGGIPADKLPVYLAAEATIVAANNVYCEPSEAGKWDKMSETARTFWRRGYADALIARVESACKAFGMDEAAWVDTVQRISDWFAQRGWLHLARPLAETLRFADTAHDTAVNLRKAKGARG